MTPLYKLIKMSPSRKRAAIKADVKEQNDAVEARIKRQIMIDRLMAETDGDTSEFWMLRVADQFALSHPDFAAFVQAYNADLRAQEAADETEVAERYWSRFADRNSERRAAALA